MSKGPKGTPVRKLLASALRTQRKVVGHGTRGGGPHLPYTDNPNPVHARGAFVTRKEVVTGKSHSILYSPYRRGYVVLDRGKRGELPAKESMAGRVSFYGKFHRDPHKAFAQFVDYEKRGQEIRSRIAKGIVSSRKERRAQGLPLIGKGHGTPWFRARMWERARTAFEGTPHEDRNYNRHFGIPVPNRMSSAEPKGARYNPKTGKMW